MNARMRVCRGVKLLMLLGGVIQSGCAHYYLPANRLDLPEAVGKSRFARLELAGTQSGSSLTATPLQSSPPEGSTELPPTELQKSWVNYFLGITTGLSEKIDVTFRIQLGAPFLVRLKYQLSGESEDVAEGGNFSTAVSASGGLLLAPGGVSYSVFDGAFILGYRLWRAHLVSLSPFFSMASLSSVDSAPGSATQFGACLGYQHTFDAVFFRIEAVLPAGDAGVSKISGVSFGGLLGFHI